MACKYHICSFVGIVIPCVSKAISGGASRKIMPKSSRFILAHFAWRTLAVFVRQSLAVDLVMNSGTNPTNIVATSSINHQLLSFLRIDTNRLLPLNPCSWSSLGEI